MAKRIDITGMKFGRLTVMDYHHTNASQYACWRCRCDCGKVVVVPGKSLRTGNTKSCGCLNIDAATERIISFNTAHSGAHTRLFRIWSSIKTRCENPNAINYKDYGGRGIKLCEEWHTFELFRDWALANGYADNLSIDRIDVDGIYEPSNCRWATNSEQANNRRTNRIIEFNGEKKTLKQWAETLGISGEALSKRLQSQNFTFESALTTPRLRRNNARTNRQSTRTRSL